MGKQKKVSVTRGNWTVKMPAHRSDMLGYNFSVFCKKYPKGAGSKELEVAGLSILSTMQRSEFVDFSKKFDQYRLHCSRNSLPSENIIEWLQFCKKWRDIRLPSDLEIQFNKNNLYSKTSESRSRVDYSMYSEDYDYSLFYAAYVRPEKKEYGIYVLKKTIKHEDQFMRFGMAFENYCAWVRKKNISIAYVMPWDSFCRNWHKWDVTVPFEQRVGA